MLLTYASRGLLKENDKILFIEYNINGEIFYSLPGGGLEAGENLMECVIREFDEETGIIIEVEKLILINEFINLTPNSISERWSNGIHQIESIFLVKRKPFSESEISHNPDIGMQGIKWMSYSELQTVQYYPEVSVNWFFNEEKDSSNIYRTKKY